MKPGLIELWTVENSKNSQVVKLVDAGEYDTNMSGLEITNTNFLAHG